MFSKRNVHYVPEIAAFGDAPGYFENRRSDFENQAGDIENRPGDFEKSARRLENQPGDFDRGV